MTLDQAIDRYTNNAEYERIHGNLQGCLDFRQLAEWLKDYKRLLEQEPCTDAVSREAVNNLYDMYRPSLATHVSEFGEVLKALPSVNPQPCDDAISRQAVLDIVNNPLNIRLDEIIKKLPPVTQKSGKWIITSMSNMAYCSECDYLFKDIPASIVKQFKYCPNCGAKMVEPGK